MVLNSLSVSDEFVVNELTRAESGLSTGEAVVGGQGVVPVLDQGVDHIEGEADQADVVVGEVGVDQGGGLAGNLRVARGWAEAVLVPLGGQDRVRPRIIAEVGIPDCRIVVKGTVDRAEVRMGTKNELMLQIVQ